MPQPVDPDPWLEAARHYSGLDEPNRASYWRLLSPEQQAALTSALQRVAVPVPATPAAVAKKGGPLSVAAFGCLGLVLGVALTILLQIMGLRRLVPELLRPSASASRSAENPPDSAPALEYLTSDCRGTPKSHEEELFCQVWKKVQSEP